MIAFYITGRIGWPAKYPYWPPKLPSRGEIGFLAGLAASGPIAYLVYNFSIPGLFRYVRGGLALGAGFSVAMSSPTNGRDMFYLIVTAVLLVWIVGLGVRRRACSLLTAAEILFVAWVLMKHGFVRSDGHVNVFLGMIMIVAAYALSRFQFTTRQTAPYLALFAALLLVALQGVSFLFPVYTAQNWSLSKSFGELNKLFNFDATLAELDKIKQSVIGANRLPPNVEALIGGSRVVVYPWEFSYGGFGIFSIEPLYTLQAYTAYTRYLDEQTAERINRRTPETEFALFQLVDIDYRNPLTDTPASWQAIYRNYAPKMDFPGGFIAARRPVVLPVRLKFKQRAELHPDQWARVASGIKTARRDAET